MNRFGGGIRTEPRLARPAIAASPGLDRVSTSRQGSARAAAAACKDREEPLTQAANCLLAGGWGADTVVRFLRLSESCVGRDAPGELRHPLCGNDARLSSRLAPDPGRRNPRGARRHAMSSA